MNAWWILALGFPLAVFVLLVAASSIVERARREEAGLVQERFTCPVLKKDVVATFARDARGDLTKVRTCSAFLFPDEITCDASCVAHLNESLTLPERASAE